MDRQAVSDVTANYHGGDEFSTLANGDAENTKARDRARILAHVSTLPGGATCDEIETALGLTHQTCSARCTELKREGALQWDGRTKRRTRNGSMARVLTTEEHRPTKVYFEDDQITLHLGDSLDVMRTLPDGSVDCIVTSPPYFGLRDYGNDGQYGLEETPADYVETMRALFHEARRVLADDGTFWLNLGDSYSTGKSGMTAKNMTTTKRDKVAGLPAKNLLGIPWRVAFALQEDGWILRNSIIWYKPNGMPESVQDRLNCKHENLFLFTKNQRYWFDLNSLREPLSEDRAPSRKARKPHDGWKENSAKGEYNPNRGGTAWSANANSLTGPQQDVLGSHPDGKNPGDVWPINTQPFGGAHFAVFPQELARRCIVAGCKPGGTVLDTFSGSGTTGLVAQKNGRKYVGIDISADYLKLSLETRLQQTTFDFDHEEATA